MKFDVVAFLEEMYPTSMRRISDLTEKKLQAKLQHKVLVKITPTPSAVFLQCFTVNFMRMCCIFYIFL